jgi:hypothetical protein
MATLCFSPPESVFVDLSPYPSRSTAFRASLTNLVTDSFDRLYLRITHRQKFVNEV